MSVSKGKKRNSVDILEGWASIAYPKWLITKDLIRRMETGVKLSTDCKLSDDCLVQIFEEGCKPTDAGDVVLIKAQVERGNLKWDKERTDKRTKIRIHK